MESSQTPPQPPDATQVPEQPPQQSPVGDTPPADAPQTVPNQEAVTGAMGSVLNEQEKPVQPNTADTMTELLHTLIEEQKQQRAEVQAMRDELKRKTPQAVVNLREETPEERAQARLSAVQEHDFYCPGCGNLVHYQQKCTGTDPSAPHQPIEVVSTQEILSGDTSKHTEAPVLAA